MTRNVLITGGNSGIGYEMALALARQGGRVMIAARDAAKSTAAAAAIRERHPAARVETLRLDLADFAQIDAFATSLLEVMPTIDVLILNAGLYTLKLHRLDNGFEAMIGIMHFGHFRLVQRLLPAVRSAAPARIVVTSSAAHHTGPINWASFTDPSRHRIGFQAYGQAKLANLLFTRELARRLAGTGVTVNAFHPGPIATDIFRQVPWPFDRLVKAFIKTPKQGADTAVWLASSPEVEGISGEYFQDRKRQRSSAASRDMKLAAQLWERSEDAMRDA